MPDPLEDRLRDFAAGVPALRPSSAAEVRRRGDRLRRRRTALVTAGAAFAVAAVTVPVLALTSSDQKTQQPVQVPTTATDTPTQEPSPSVSTPPTTPSTPPTSPPTSSPTTQPASPPTTAADTPAPPPLTDAALPSADDLPSLDDTIGPWQVSEPADGRMIGCQPVGEEVDAADRRTRFYTAWSAEVLPPGVENGVVADARVTVLQTRSAAEAEAAADTVTGWIRTCADPVDPALRDPYDLGELVVTDDGTYAIHAYSAAEKCSDDCDATWYDAMGVLASQDRLVVVTVREAGGAYEPDGLDAAMRDLLRTVAGLNAIG